MKLSPDGSYVVYIANQETDEVFDIYRVPIGGGTAIKLNDDLIGSSIVTRFYLSPDSSRVIYRVDQQVGDPTRLRELFVSYQEPALLPPDLSESTKQASTTNAQLGETVTYTLHISNTGSPLTSTIALTDVIPSGLTYQTNSFTATDGTVDDSAAPTLTWSGVLPESQMATLTYAVAVTETNASQITNMATIDFGAGGTLLLAETISTTVSISEESIYLPLILFE